MNISIRKTQEGIEETAIISVVNKSVNGQTKLTIEQQLMDYVRNHLYPGHIGLNIYQSVEKDTASIVVIRNINDIPDQLVDI